MRNQHGGDITGYIRRFGEKPLDFSTSLNPLGMPKVALLAAHEAVDNSISYPDPFSRDLTEALAQRLSIPESYFIFGNGSADIIYRFAIATKPRKTLLPVPSFSEYECAVQTVGSEIEYYYLQRENDFILTEDILPRITPETDVLFLCQPNNPTGQLIDPGLLKAILDKCDATETLLFMDECFCPLVKNWEPYSLLETATTNQNIFILGSFTKLFGMAGLRLGFGLTANAELRIHCTLAGQPWSVSTVAQMAGLASLLDYAYLERSLDLIESEKKKLAETLLNLGFTVLGSKANFIFFHAPVPGLDRVLAENGIMIRNCNTFKGLVDGWYRIGIQKPEDNAVLIHTLTELAKRNYR